MEILNNIWMALTTPNQELVNILLIPMSVIENFLTMLLFLSIFSMKTTQKQKIIYVVTGSIISLLSVYIIPNPINILFDYLMFIIVCHYNFKISFLKSSVAIIISAIIYALVGMLIGNPYLTLLQISSEQMDIVPIYRFFYLLIMYSVILIISLIVKNKKFYLDILEDIDKRNKYIIGSNLVLGFFTLAIQAVITFYYTDVLPILITFLSFISLLAYFVISIFSLTRVMKLTLTTRKLESAEEYNKTLHILHDSVRGFKHDFDNIVTTIGGYVRTNDIEGLKNYYVELEDDCQRVNNLYLLNPEIVNNPRYLQFTH